MELPAGESECDKPGEQPERLGSAGEQSELTTTSPQSLVLRTEPGALPAGPVEVSNKDPKENPSQHTSDLKQMLDDIMEVIRADLGANNEKIQRLQESVKVNLSSVKADISTNNEKIQLFQESVKTDLSGVKADLSSVEGRH
jgi:ElaB/YqjD/DUF883 family membrane-anchored ribosome-binding protein